LPASLHNRSDSHHAFYYIFVRTTTMLPRSRRHVANDVAKLVSDVAIYLAKLVIWTVGWQHLIPVLNTERAFAAVFRLSLSDYGRNLVSWHQRGLLNPPLGQRSKVRERSTR
jgi:hypothetical protein